MRDDSGVLTDIKLAEFWVVLPASRDQGMEVTGTSLQRYWDLGGGFKYVFFLPLPGEMIQFDEHIFQTGWNHQVDILWDTVVRWFDAWHIIVYCHSMFA